MKKGRELITREFTDTLKDSYETEPISKVSKWRKDKSKRILKHLRIAESVIVFICKYRRSCYHILESISRRFSCIWRDEDTDRWSKSWLSSRFSDHLLCFCFCLIKYLIWIPSRCTWSITPAFFIFYKTIQKPRDRSGDTLKNWDKESRFDSFLIFSFCYESCCLLCMSIPWVSKRFYDELYRCDICFFERSKIISKCRKWIVFEVFIRLYRIDIIIILTHRGCLKGKSERFNLWKVSTIDDLHLCIRIIRCDLLEEKRMMLTVAWDIKMYHPIVIHKLERYLCMPEYKVHYRIESAWLSQIMDRLIKYWHDPDFFLEVFLRLTLFIELRICTRKCHFHMYEPSCHEYLISETDYLQ